MAPERRFGLPHPLDAETPEEPSSGRRSGLWESVKRALGGAPSPPEPPAALPLAHLPASPPPIPARAPVERLHAERPPAEPAAPPARSEADPALQPVVPFLDEPLIETPAGAAPEPIPKADLPESSPSAEATAHTTPVNIGASTEPIEAKPGTPRLARGLASFSRHNSEREKKFAHLLRDDPSGGGKRQKRPKKSG